MHPSEQNLTFAIFIKSYDFSGMHNFCVRKDYLQEKIKELRDMDKSHTGACRICDGDSDSFINIEFERHNLRVNGQIGGTHNDNYMFFSFTADRTLLGLCANILRDFVAV